MRMFLRTRCGKNSSSASRHSTWTGNPQMRRPIDGFQHALPKLPSEEESHAHRARAKVIRSGQPGSLRIFLSWPLLNAPTFDRPDDKYDRRHSIAA